MNLTSCGLLLMISTLKCYKYNLLITQQTLLHLGDNMLQAGMLIIAVVFTVASAGN